MMDKEKIRQEIERRIEQCHRLLARELLERERNEINLCLQQYKELLQFIDSLPEEPKCVYNRTLAERKKYCKFCSIACDARIEEPASDDLEEAAKKYAMKEYPWQHGYESWDSPIKDFKAGAEWQKQQMMKDGIEGEIGDFMPIIEVGEMNNYLNYVKAHGLKTGDKVKIIIVKEKQQ